MPGSFVVKNGSKVDRLGERARDDLRRLPDQVRGLNENALRAGTPGEGEEVLHHLGPAGGARLDDLQGGLRPGIPELPPEQRDRHRDRHEDGREDVVEVVGDAAREGPDALHPLRPQELGLEELLLREVGIRDRS